VGFERLGENTALRKKGFAISEREISFERASKKMKDGEIIKSLREQELREKD